VLPLVRACLRVLGEPPDIVRVAGLSAAAVAAGLAAVRDLRPTHVVAVERPGRAADGGYYNARGRPVADLTRRSTPCCAGARASPLPSGSEPAATRSGWAGSGRAWRGTCRGDGRSDPWSGPII